MTKHRVIPWTVLILLVAAVWLFFVHGLAKSPSANPGSEDEDSSPSSPLPFRNSPRELASVSALAPVSGELSAKLDFQKKVHDCFPALASENLENPEKLLQQEVAVSPVQKTEFEMENTHIELPDGSLRRIHIIPSERGSSSELRELRYFKLDGEGLPERIPLSEKQTYNPPQEFVDSLKSQGRVVFHQLKQHEWLQNGTQIALNQVDDKIFEMQIFGPGKILSCRAMKCACH